MTRQPRTTRRTLEDLLWLGAGVVVGYSTKRWVSWAHKQLVQWLYPTGPLQLDRPLVTFDIESTGVNVSKDKIVEIAAIKLMPDGTVAVKGPQRLNPGIPLSAEVTAIHGITDDDLADCPSFADVAHEWQEFMQDCDLHGYNAKKFDVPLLRNEFKRCGVHDFPPVGVPVVDSFRIFTQQEPRSLAAAVQFYCGRPQQQSTAHSALADAQNTLDVLIEQVRSYKDLPRRVSELANICGRPNRAQDVTHDGKFQWRGEIPVVAFGKYAGEPIAALITFHKDYLRWMSGQDFSDESLTVVSQALKGLLPTKDGTWQPLVFEPPPDQQQQQQRPQQQHVNRRAVGAGKPANSSQSQQQQHTTSSSSMTATNSAGGANLQQSLATPQQQQQQSSTRNEGSPQTLVQANFSNQDGVTVAGADASSSIGWPDLNTHNIGGPTSAPDDNSDGWATAAAVTSSSSSPQGWSMVDESDPAQQQPSQQQVSNPEPQQIQHEDGV